MHLRRASLMPPSGFLPVRLHFDISVCLMPDELFGSLLTILGFTASEGSHDAREEVVITSEAAQRKRGMPHPGVCFVCLFVMLSLFLKGW